MLVQIMELIKKMIVSENNEQEKDKEEKDKQDSAVSAEEVIEDDNRPVIRKRACYANRELSWLKFNERVLGEAEDESVPLCERLSFVSIFQSNLDEFFMVRVGSLYDQMLLFDNSRENKTRMTASEQLVHIFKDTRKLLKHKDDVYFELMDQLKQRGVELIRFKDIETEDVDYLKQYFKKSIMPILSPQVIGKKQPFPFLKNKEIYAVARLKAKNSEKLGVVPCSSEVFSRLISIPSDKKKYILVEELILHFMPEIFDNYTVKSKSLIRIIRNADIDVDEAYEDEDIDYRNAMERLIKERRKLCPVKMEYTRVPDEKVIVYLCKELGLKKEQVFKCEAPLEMSFVSTIQDVFRAKKELFYPKRKPQKSIYVDENTAMIEQIRKKDILLSYPYESMSPFIRLLEEAGHDKNVISIKMTLYRVAKNSRIVEALIDAAENGKDVVVLVELRARFDEENNIEWSRRLEDAGCRIIYGIDYVKVHSKLCLITYKDDEKIKHITQIGTGNYNEKTAAVYTDLSLMTADERIAGEAAETFNKLCMAEVMDETHYLMVAPKCLQNKILNYIDEEIEHARNNEPAYIGVKVNSLTDKKIIDKLIEASQAGVRTDLIIRGICCLIPQIEGYTENIRIISIVGRYLEHSRIYIFGTPDRDNIYISSADFMTRNTVRRVEVAAPIYDEDIKTRIRDKFNIMLHDNVNAHQLNNNGQYTKIMPEGPEEELVNSQQEEYEK